MSKAAEEFNRLLEGDKGIILSGNIGEEEKLSFVSGASEGRVCVIENAVQIKDAKALLDRRKYQIKLNLRNYENIYSFLDALVTENLSLFSNFPEYEDMLKINRSTVCDRIREDILSPKNKDDYLSYDWFVDYILDELGKNDLIKPLQKEFKRLKFGYFEPRNLLKVCKMTDDERNVTKHKRFDEFYYEIKELKEQHDQQEVVYGDLVDEFFGNKNALPYWLDNLQKMCQTDPEQKCILYIKDFDALAPIWQEDIFSLITTGRWLGDSRMPLPSNARVVLSNCFKDNRYTSSSRIANFDINIIKEKESKEYLPQANEEDEKV